MTSLLKRARASDCAVVISVGTSGACVVSDVARSLLSHVTLYEMLEP